MNYTKLRHLFALQVEHLGKNAILVYGALIKLMYNQDKWRNKPGNFVYKHKKCSHMTNLLDRK